MKPQHYFTAFCLMFLSACFGADVRIRSLSTTATTPASDDYMAVDGTTNGTRKILASKFPTIDGAFTANYIGIATGAGSLTTSAYLYQYGDALVQDTTGSHSYMMIRALTSTYSSWLDLSTATKSWKLQASGTADTLSIYDGLTHFDITSTGNITTSYAKVYSTKPATTSTTGALVVSGGLGVGGNIVAGANITGNVITANTFNATTGNVTTLTVSSVSGLPDVWVIPIGDETTALTTGTAKVTFRAPYAATVTAVRASLTTVSSSGTPTFDINEGGTSILSTKLTIDANEKTSTTAATAPVISDSAIADDAEITIDIDTAGTGAAGAKIAIFVTR